MRNAGLANLMLGAGTFGVALLYFYALALSIVAIVKGALPEYLVVAAWAVVSLVLYISYHRRRQGSSADQP